MSGAPFWMSAPGVRPDVSTEAAEPGPPPVAAHGRGAGDTRLNARRHLPGEAVQNRTRARHRT